MQTAIHQKLSVLHIYACTRYESNTMSQVKASCRKCTTFCFTMETSYVPQIVTVKTHHNITLRNGQVTENQL